MLFRVVPWSKYFRALRRPLAVLALGAGLAAWIRCGPVPADLLTRAQERSTVVLDRRGEPLYESRSPGGLRAEHIDASALPPVLVAATLAAEDHRFFSHHGIDVRGIARAMRHDLAEGRVVEGGSTISQQVAKLLIQRRDGIARRGLGAKLRELVLALRLEHRFSKRELLAVYLNVASYGNQISGAAKASHAYFGVGPDMLTAAQAAFLAALPQRPSAFNPWKTLAVSRARQRAILRAMHEAGALPQPALDEALAERLAVTPRSSPFDAPHFVDMVLASFGSTPPAEVRTTLDLALQREVEGIIAAERPSLVAHGAANVSVVVMDNATGGWLAWEGSGNYDDRDHGGTIDGPTVPRQPGSALKPFTYALAFETGSTPATVLADIPSHFPTAEPGILYSPRNYDGRYRGAMRARSALAGSENVPAVSLASELGIDGLLRFLKKAGLTTLDRTPSYYGLGLTLGNAEVRLDQLVAAYATFARGGLYRQPHFLLDDASGGEERRIVSERTAFWITDVLGDPDARAFTFGRGGALEFPFPVAVKTGTSQAYHDNWTVGYTRDVTVGVWVGNFDRSPLRDSSGVTGAGPIFHAVMLAAARRAGSTALREGDAIVPRPADLVATRICSLSGMRAKPECPSKMLEWMPADAQPAPCDWHHASDEGLITVYPPEYRAWAASELATVDRPARAVDRAARRPARQGEAVEHGARPLLAIVSPPPGAIYSVDPTLRREFQALPLKAVAGHPTTVTWSVDGQSLGAASSETSVSWPLRVGTHRIEAVDAAGRRAITSIVVR